MDKRDSRVLQKAKQYAFLLLKFRMRSEKEMSQRLRKKKFDQAAVAQTVSFLKEKGFLNDTDFARSWIDSRIKRYLGLRKIREELKLKGIDNEIINQQIGRIKEEYSEEELVEKLAREKFAKSQGLDPQKAKRRIFSYLLRHGFSPDVVIDALSRL